MSEINDTIDARLDEARPNRYRPEQDEWLTAIIDDVAVTISIEEAQKRVARDLVVRREAEATKRTNRVLRDIFKTGNLPLDWLDMQRCPLSINGERVALGACTPDDFREFANIERRRAAKEHATRNESCDGARFLADMIEKNGARRASDLVLLDVAS